MEIPRYACDAEMCWPAARQIRRLRNGGRGRVEEDDDDKGPFRTYDLSYVVVVPSLFTILGFREREPSGCPDRKRLKEHETNNTK